MTRVMYDSISLASLPAGADMYAGYDDGNWPDANAIAQKFPGKTVIRVTVFPSDNEGDCLDVETGDATPGQAPAWVAKRRTAGHGGPLVYCSESAWPTVRQAFASQNVPEPAYWVAGYPGAEGDAIPAGAIGHQWIDRGPYDESIMVDYLPGIDAAPPAPPVPTPTPIPPPPIGDDRSMGSPLVVDGNPATQVVYVAADGSVVQLQYVDGKGWQHNNLTQIAGAPAAVTTD